MNSSGQFNVPFGRPCAEASLADEANLIACGEALAKKGVEILSGDFEETLKGARRGDLVYLDPPYVTGHSNNGFIDYNEVLFSWHDQVRLARTASKLVARGVTVIASNADHPAIRDLYADFQITTFDRKATISGDTKKRGRSNEIIAVSAHPENANG